MVALKQIQPHELSEYSEKNQWKFYRVLEKQVKKKI